MAAPPPPSTPFPPESVTPAPPPDGPAAAPPLAPGAGDPARIRWRAALWPLPEPEWLGEGAAFVYNPLSGKTHLLRPVALALLEELAERPATVGELGERLALSGEGEGINRLVRLCWELGELGLLDPERP